ncbi:YkoF family thiamine/hydroxymethylpyrimidine-binding protein [Jannaschia seohaensis]|uniref:YKOF-related Family n=1 Tax=Jannaschia seohaensis TaxID=475081 RepID=A0A2Y9C0D6_9RHOB|nr:YkoF family thiamine/hydroxymethylpyrimidine-binding protein [Jannaschia seohaensis]PWJ19330.1 YKOF-related protein [Jannaschia seohaensis]SSA45992.1 YKOF-related Family [Jannaschia seohaensis]
MFSGAQVSLYPMSDDFVGIILGAIGSLDPWRDRLRIETDSLSTLMVGPPDVLFPAMRDLFCAAARSGVHTTMHATVSRGCPGEPDDPICTPVAGPSRDLSLAERVEACRAVVATAPVLEQEISVQFSLYPLGVGHHMDEIYGCIEFLKTSGTFLRSKNFCTALRGDAGPVFETLSQAFTGFGATAGHLAMDVTVSANSPSDR